MGNWKSPGLAFFFGAGASAHLGYPTVTNFFDKCKIDGFPHYDCEQLWRYIRILENRSPDEKYPRINAEAVFSLAEQVLQVDKALSIDSGPFPSKHATRRPGLPTKISPADLHRKLMDGIIGIYGTMPTHPAHVPDPLGELVKEVKAVVPYGHVVWFFTTNYDTVIESSFGTWIARGEEPLDRLRLVTGIGQQRPHRLDVQSFPFTAGSKELVVNLVKLHGSATWKHETPKPDSPILETDMRGPTNYDCALFFGYKRVPEEEPFVGLHRLFKRVLLTPVTLVSIGFQFADPFLRELVNFALRANPKLSVLCCLRSEPKDGSAVDGLVASHGFRFKLLRDGEGALVPFGEKHFCTYLRQELGLYWERASVGRRKSD